MFAEALQLINTSLRLKYYTGKNVINILFFVSLVR